MTQKTFLIDGSIESTDGHLTLNQNLHLNGSLIVGGKTIFTDNGVYSPLGDGLSGMNINDLDDVDTVGLADGTVLVYSTTSQKWVPTTLASGGGSSYTDADVAVYLNTNLATAIVPSANAAYDLGTTSARFRNLYLSGSTLYTGATRLESNIVTGAMTIKGADDGTRTLTAKQFILDDSAVNATETVVIRKAASGIEFVRIDTSSGAETVISIGSGGGSASEATSTVLGTTYAQQDTALNNAFFGYAAGNATITGQSNTGVGEDALKSLTTANWNTVVGNGSGRALNTGGSNTFVGGLIARNATAGDQNSALGFTALYNLTSGIHNSAFGANAGYFNTTGTGNVFFGRDAGKGIIIGDYNTTVGLGSMAQEGYRNVVIGQGAVVGTGGSIDNSVIIGTGSAILLSSGQNNTIIGYKAGATLTGGNGNIIIGDKAEPSSSTTSNELTLGDSTIARIRIPGIGFDTGNAVDGQYLAWNVAGNSLDWVSPAGGISAILQDTSPQLGGSLDTNGHRIGGTSNILIQPDGVITTGENAYGLHTVINGGYGATTDGSTAQAGNVYINSGTTNSTGQNNPGSVYVGNTTAYTYLGSTSLTDTSARTYQYSPNSYHGWQVRQKNADNSEVVLLQAYNAGGSDARLKIRGSIWPSVDGSDGQVLTTNGAGAMSWTTASAAADAVTLGGKPASDYVTTDTTLDMNRNIIKNAVLSATPESDMVMIPALMNDWGFARPRGATITATDANGTVTVSNSSFDAMFDATASIWAPAVGVTETDALVIEITNLPKPLNYAAWVGMSFGANWNRCNGIKIETYSNQHSVWQEQFYTTANNDEIITTAVAYPGYTGSKQTTGIRISLWAPASGTTTRIANIFGWDYAADLGTALYVDRSGGTVYGTITQTSDERFKTDIVTLPNALETVSQLRGVSFISTLTDEVSHGLIAQEVEPIVPELVKTDEQTGIKSIAYSNTVGLLVEAVKDLKAMVEAQAAEIEALKNK